MRITILLNGENVISLMRRAGYGFQKEASGEMAFVRRVGQSPFPRFHVYVIKADSRQPTAASTSTKQITVNLHIDQRQPTYGSGSVHGGEYEGPIVAAEIERLRALAIASPSTPAVPPEEKKSFWKRLFS